MLLNKKTSGELLLKLNHLNNWLYFALAVNSTYSFIWDIKMDWHLELFDGLFLVISERKLLILLFLFLIIDSKF